MLKLILENCNAQNERLFLHLSTALGLLVGMDEWQDAL
jgi:hypothetical protein